MAVQQTKVLITSVGSRVGLGLLESLRPVRDRIAVIGVNSVAEAPQNFLCDRSYLAPATAARDAFALRLRSIIEMERPAAVLAGRDEELDCLAGLAADPALSDVVFLTPGLDAVPICNDKYETWRFAQAHGLPFAETAIDAEGLRRIVARTGYPVIAKPRHGGHASRGVHIVRDDDEAARALAAGRFVFQAFIEPSSASTDLSRDLAFGVPWSLQMRDIRHAAEGVIDRNGDVVCVSTVVSDTTGGLSLRMAVVDDPEIEGVHRAYAGALAARGHFGPLNLQGKKTATGAFVPYEINGRFTGSVMARALQGYNQVVHALDYFLTGRRPPQRHQADGRPTTVQTPLYFSIDPSAASTLETQGRWDANRPLATGDFGGQEELVRFIEDKAPNWPRVQELLALSVRAGRSANFGPVQHQLAAHVASMLALDSSRAVVSASSATAALHALTGVYAAKAGRPLVWAISAYGHPSTMIGPLAGRVRVVDCDQSGLIDIGALSELAAESWDGLIATDLFGAQPDFSQLAGLCAAAGKPMIIDAAVSYPACRPPSVRVSEIVSFHHTKPWGYGEGGCAIVDASLADEIRALVNFGDGTDPGFAGFAGNGKMSDIAAAFILQRLESMEHWADGYRSQRQRITELAVSEGLSVLVTPKADVVAPHVPVLARGPVALSDLPQAPFAVAKYYRPLGSGAVAANLYSRVVNVPCHPGMARIADATLREFLRALPAEKAQSAAL